MKSQWFGGFAVVVVSSFGCSAKIVEEPTPVVLEGFACLGKKPTPPTLPVEVELTLNVFDASGGTGTLADLSFNVCPSTADVACAAPLKTGKTDAKGVLTFKVPTDARAGGFVGYIELSPQSLAPKDKDGKVIATKSPVRMPYLMPFATPPNKSMTIPISSFTQEDFVAVFLTANGLTYNATEAHLSAGAADCADKDAANIVFELGTPVHSGPNTRTIYFTKDFAVTTPPALTQTLSNGLGGFVNLQTVGLPSVAQVLAKFSGTVVAKANVPIKAGYLTTFRLPPTE